MHRLSDREQAILMLLVFILPPIITWAALGMPTDRASLGILLSAVLSGILVFVKELLGGTPPKENPGSNPSNRDDPVTAKLCAAYRDALKAEIKGLKSTIIVGLSISTAIISLILYGIEISGL